jgi:hypothetical protein
MTRESAGTRVNSSGLVETVELLGSELVVNGDFENNVIGWNKFKSNATESWNSGGYLDFTKTGVSGRLGSDVLIETNKTYKISVNVISLGGILDLYVGLSDFESPYAGVTSTPLVVGTNTFYLTFAGSASSKGVYLQSAGSNYFGLTASIDSISVKESTKNNLARVDYDGTASSLLVEPQRTNLITYSEDFSDSSWIKSRSTFTSDSIQSPSGLINMGYLTEDTTANNTHYMRDFLTVTDGVNYTLSVFAKAKERDIICLGDNAAAQSSTGVWFDLTNGLVLTQRSGYVGSIKDFGNGIYRCSVTYSTSASRQYVDIALSLSDRVNVYTGDGTSGAYFWGAQLEEGSYPTSYIPNFGTSLGVTRNQDQYSKTGISNLINSEEGVLFAEMAVLSDDSTLKSITLSDGTGGNRVIINYSNASNRLTADVRVGAVGQAFMQTYSYTITNFLKIALKYKENDFALWVNGDEVAIVDDGSTFPANTLNRLGLDNGAAISSGELLFGKVKQLQVFKTTDIDLAALTS